METEDHLRNLYDKARALIHQGEEITPESLRQEFGLSKYTASCLLHMLDTGEYWPELEDIYDRDGSANLEGKDESKNSMIEFLEDIPPYEKSATCGKRIFF